MTKSLKELLTQIVNKLKATSEDIVFYDKTVTTSYSSGAVGSRGAQVSFANPAPNSYYIHSITIRSINDSSSYMVLPFYYNGDGKFYVNFYRCTTSACSNATATVRITYTKSIGGGMIN